MKVWEKIESKNVLEELFTTSVYDYIDHLHTPTVYYNSCQTEF